MEKIQAGKFVQLAYEIFVADEQGDASMFKFTREHPDAFVFGLDPGMLPAFSSGCVSAMGLAWKSGIAAEVLSQPSLAIGTNLYNSKVYLETAELFAWTLVVILLSLLIEKGIMFFFSRVVRNRRKYD